MQDVESLALRVRADRLSLLDQSRLPHAEVWLAIDDVAAMVEAISALRVRGAPLIGVAAALLVGLRAQAGDTRADLAAAIERLAGARPTAVNLGAAMHRLGRDLAARDWRARVVASAERLFARDRGLCEAMAEHGAALVAPGERILTHCNTGGLATAGVGTALGVIRRAHEQGKAISVWVAETRPLLQGARLTAWELGALGIDHRIVVDSAAASLMAAGEVDRVVVGADRIAANGDFANKIGTYALAVLAHYHGVAFYVVAPATTVDAACATGADIPIEARAAEEVRGVAGAAGNLRWAPVGARAYNPAFDVTPAALVTRWILDVGVYAAADIAGGALADTARAAV